MEKVLVYADTIREARAFYPERPNQMVGYRLIKDEGKEEADIVLYAKEYKKKDKK